MTLLLAIVQDSVVVESPLPGGAATFVRFLLQVVPQWVQIAGVIVGFVAAVGAAYLLITRRRALSQVLGRQSTRVKVALGIGAGVVLVGCIAAGATSWDYMQHDNGFCTGCHVMETAFFKFEESEHDSLSCHDCHQQSIFASSRQLYLWVAERPDDIGEHAPVANNVCETCHVTGEPEVWQRIASTAGHRTHLEIDTLEVMCVACHGQEVHRFVPVDQTCGQSGCHVSQDTDISIGAMQEQTALHCTTCHQFVVDVPQLATLDSAASAMTPSFERCTSCHEMQAVLDDFDPVLDPHLGTCGSCHNPHEQTAAVDAAATCTTSGCHSDWQNEPFHTGTSHLNVGESCSVCHDPHQARVDASDCTTCHVEVMNRNDVPQAVRDRLRRVAPFDTNAVLRGQVGALADRPPPMTGLIRSPPAAFLGVGVTAPNALLPIPSFAQEPVTPPDSFPHAPHEELSCLNCHTTSGGHGPLTFEVPRGCQICHHAAEREVDCVDCHSTLSSSIAATLTVAVDGSPQRDRSVVFNHEQHETTACSSCHTEPVTLASTDGIETCSACHEEHHVAGVTCVQCHDNQSDQSVVAHRPPVDAHRACDECHTQSVVTRLFPDEQFCTTCHELSSEHPVDQERACTICHFLVPPEQFRRHLVGTKRQP